MTQLTLHPAGGYHYLPHRIAFGDGVVAAAGFEIVHAAFFKPLPFAQGFDAAVAYLKSIQTRAGAATTPPSEPRP
mgnify:CR=1 FL=1